MQSEHTVALAALQVAARGRSVFICNNMFVPPDQTRTPNGGITQDMDVWGIFRYLCVESELPQLLARRLFIIVLSVLTTGSNKLCHGFSDEFQTPAVSLQTPGVIIPRERHVSSSPYRSTSVKQPSMHGGGKREKKKKRERLITCV